MKKLNFWSTMLLALVALPMAVACSSDDDDEPINIDDAVGTWICIQSKDTYQGKTYENQIVGAEVTVSKNGTYVMSYGELTETGTFVVDGNVITARGKMAFDGTTYSETAVITITIKGNKMTWSGTSTNGVTFKYVFQKEKTD